MRQDDGKENNQLPDLFPGFVSSDWRQPPPTGVSAVEQTSTASLKSAAATRNGLEISDEYRTE